MKTVADFLQKHPFFSGLTPQQTSFIAGCGRLVQYHSGDILAKQGDDADDFFLIREGKIALAIERPSEEAFIFQTLYDKEIVGLSWLIPPYKWTATAKCQSDTKAIVFSGKCLREKCEKDHDLGFHMMRHLLEVMVTREDALKLHLLDIYTRRSR
jgi:signal-transduction protein with cAMP-binding, CBS, and nucleotidyltransferase domain